MPDHKIEIEISTKATGQGAQETAANLDQLKGAAREAARATNESVAADKKATSAKAEFKKGVKELAEEIPVLGKALKMASNPVSAIVETWKMAAEALKRSFEEFKNVMTNGDWQDGSSGLDAYREAISQADVEMAKFNITLGEMSQSHDTVSDKIASEVEKLNEEEAAMGKVMAARKQLELARAKNPGDVQEIESRYAAQGIASRRKFQAQRMELDNVEMKGLNKDISTLTAEVSTGKRGVLENQAEQKRVAGQKKAAEHNLATAEEELKKTEDYLGDKSLFRLDPGGLYARSARDRRDELQQVIASQKNLVEGYGNKGSELTVQGAALESAQQERMSRLTKMNSRRNELGARMQVDAGTESRQQQTENTVAGLEAQTRITTALDKNRAQQDAVANKLVESITKGNDMQGETLRKLEELRSEQQRLDAQLRALNKTAPKVN